MQNLFFTGKFAFLFKKLCFQQTHSCYGNDLLTSKVIVKTPCGPLYIVHWGLSNSIRRRKTRQNLFFTVKFAFLFRNLCFQQTLRYYRNDPLTSTVIVKKTLWTLIKYPWGFSHSIWREIIGHNLFFTGKFAFLFKKLCFQQTHSCYGNDLLTSKVFVKTPCGPL